MFSGCHSTGISTPKIPKSSDKIKQRNHQNYIGKERGKDQTQDFKGQIDLLSMRTSLQGQV